MVTLVKLISLISKSVFGQRKKGENEVPVLIIVGQEREVREEVKAC